MNAFTIKAYSATPPASSQTNDLFAIKTGATGVWTGHDNQITRYYGAITGYLFYTPSDYAEYFCIDVDGAGTPGTLLFIIATGWQIIGGSGASTPSGTGFVHVTGGTQDTAAQTVSTADIGANQITLAKMANLAQDNFIGRVTASTGVPETATITAAARTVLDDASVGAMVDTLGGATSTGTGGLVRTTSPALVTPTGIISSDVGLGSVTNDAQTKAAIVPNTAPSAGQILAGNSGGTAYAPVTMGTDATISSAGALTIADAAVSLAKMANMTTSSLIYRKTAGTGVPEVNTLATVKTDLALVKSDVGLGSVDNTSDAGKPVSTAQQTALDLKANLAGPTFTGTVGGITATMVGLGSVTNDAQTKAAIVPNTAPAAGEILVGNAGGTAYAKAAMGTDATLASTGALTIAAAAVTLAKMANLAQDQFIGRTTASTGVPETATITAAARTVLDDATVAAMVDTLGGAAAGGTGGLARLNGATFAGTPSLPTGTTGTTQSPADNSTKLATTAYVDALGALKAALAGATFTGLVTLPVGTTALASLNMQSGTKKTTPAIGDHEFDGTAFFETVDTTNSRTQRSGQNIFRLAANGSAIGAGIADYFGANSSLPTVTNGIYELTFYLYYLKTTAGTVTYTLTNTQTYTNCVAFYEQSVVGGIAANGAMSGSGVVTGTTAALVIGGATGSLTTAVNHFAIIRAIAECGTAGNIRLRCTESAGTITPLRGSYYTARRLFAGNVGTFAA